MIAGALPRLIRRTAADRSRRRPCDLCGTPLAEDHRHLLDVRDRRPLCACYACSVLFQREEAGEGHYRLVPDRRVPVSGLPPACLGVPVGLAFFVRHADGQVVAHYPSPAGATRWTIEPRAWESAVRLCPALADLRTEVEALLVNTARGRSEAWLVPIEDCYRVIAVVRRHWTGMFGGDRVWPEIERFFDDLRRCHGTDTNG
ncbi:DUF5947 family protein [Actinoallomurus sp. NBC_01490]|uniref:DUF5947 family protein n=1 Tax=Actinoallomurus sp. NBC_01490 TaxID=2903557 RepID=UPI002E33FDEC|nr:DUF5947 family protein [Actinoallomurus sp. NBC_01490]